ncbi:MAG: ABC transporter permease [Chloroflexi bacterium]|nr:ABC transporter permease [Chloroflexota bacterium]
MGSAVVDIPGEAEEEARQPSISPWRAALRRLLRKKIAVIALLLIGAFYFVGLFAPLLAPCRLSFCPLSTQDYRSQDLDNTLLGPSLDHPFGTDRLGRDQLSRVIWSARTTIIVTIATVVAGSLLLSVGLGLLSGYMGGKVDTIIMRTGEAFGSLPALPMLILINATMRDRVRGWVDGFERNLSTGDPAFIAVLGILTLVAIVGIVAWLLESRRNGGWIALSVVAAFLILALWGLQAVFATPGASDYFLIFGALSLFFWVGSARVIRSQVLALRETEYVIAARSMGAGTWRILGSHLLPNVSPIIIVGVSASLGAIAGSEIALTFLGVGVHDPTPSFGALIFDGGTSQPVIRNHPHLLIFPAVVVGMLIFSFNLLGDALNDVLTPKAR